MAMRCLQTGTVTIRQIGHLPTNNRRGVVMTSDTIVVETVQDAREYLHRFIEENREVLAWLAEN